MAPPDRSLDLLVFAAAGARFGLDAAQIEELRAAPQADPVTGEPPAGLFVRRADRDVPVVELADVLGMGRPVPPGTGKLALARSAEPAVCFHIGDPEEMVRVPADKIFMLPPLIEAMVRGRGMWGLALHDEQLVILVDLEEAAARALHG